MTDYVQAFTMKSESLNTKLYRMKNSLYIIAGLLLVIWGIIFWGLNGSGFVHVLLVLAGIIVLIRLIFDKQLSK